VTNTTIAEGLDLPIGQKFFGGILTYMICGSAQDYAWEFRK